MSYIVAIYFLKSAIMFLFRYLLAPSQFLLINIFLTAIIILLIYLNLKLILKRSLLVFIFVEIFLALIIVISLIQGNADNLLLMRYAFFLMFQYIPIAMYIYSVKNKELFYKIFLNMSFYISSFLSIFAFLLIRDGSPYNMSLSYAILIPALFHLNEIFSTKPNKRNLHFVFFLIDMLVMVLYGARGPFLGIIMLFLIKTLFSTTLPKKIVIVLLTTFFFTLFLIYFNDVGRIILNILDNMGYNSRTIWLLFTGKINHDAGRREIIVYYFTNILQKPILGWGVNGGWIAPGLYPHNLIVEILHSFGFIIGSIFCFILSFFSIKMIKQKDKMLRDLLFIFFSASLPLIMLSGNFLGSFYFWIFIILSINPKKVIALTRYIKRNE